MSSKKVQAKRLTKSAAEQLLATGEWTADRELAELIKHPAYVNSKREALVLAPYTGGTALYSDREELLRQLSAPARSTHLLEGRLVYERDFEAHVPELVRRLPGLISVDDAVLDLSEASLALVDEAVRRVGFATALKPELFSALVAYVGEVVRTVVQGRWNVVEAAPVWEPWVIGQDGRSHPVFALVYKELRKGRRGSLRGAVDGQLKAGRLG